MDAIDELSLVLVCKVDAIDELSLVLVCKVDAMNELLQGSTQLNSTQLSLVCKEHAIAWSVTDRNLFDGFFCQFSCKSTFTYIDFLRR